ncbi:MAG: aspartate aminotransferase family protein [Dehalococcoidia bacterium]|nr:aspartate aminotransferase family protein [Dehalococcoidia bacterium]
MTTILERFEELHPSSRRLHERARQVFPDGVTHDIRYFTPFPIYVERAQGSRKWDVDGNEIVDYVMGHGALLLGHNHPQVREAVARQVERGTHYGASHELEVAWAERVCDLIDCAESVRFTSSGTEATMMAVRLARAYTGRSTLVRFRQHFHGWNDNVVGAPDREGVHPHAFGVPDETLSNVVVVPQNDPAVLRQTLRDEDVAAVILEPTGASWGSVPLDPEMLPVVRDATRQAGTVLIFDEVVTGFRVSPGGVQRATGVTPDLTTLAKILAGGLPGGAVAGQREVVSLIEFGAGDRGDYGGRVPHPGTFNANPLSAAAGSTALEVVASGEPNRHAETLNRALVPRLNEVMRHEGVAGCAFGQASMFHIVVGAECPQPVGDFAWDWQGRPGDRLPRMSPEAIWALRRGMINEGVDLMGTGGMVSAAHSDEDVEHTVQAFSRTIRTMNDEHVAGERP